MESLAELRGKMMVIFMGITIAAAGLALSIAALLYLTSSGSPDKIKKAKEYMVNGITALVVAALAGTFVSFLEGGIPIVTDAFGANGIFSFITGSFQSAADAVLTFGVAAAGFMIAYSGILYILAAGNADKVKKAVTSLTTSLYGLVIIILLGTIFNLIRTFLAV